MPRAIHATYSNPGSKHACCTTGDPARRVQNKDIPAHCKAKEEQAAREQVAIRGTEERAKQTESQSGKHRQQPAQGAYSLHKPMAMCEAQHSGMLSMRSMSIGRQTAYVHHWTASNSQVIVPTAQNQSLNLETLACCRLAVRVKKLLI